MKSKKIIALVLSASLVATQNNIITLANINKINYSQNNIEKLQTNSLEDNKIHIKGAWWQTHDEFVIGFNKNEKKIKVYNQGNWYSYRNYGYGHYCRIQIFRKGAGEVLNIELLGWDTGNSPKLNVLKDFKYEYGDVIKFHFREPDKQIIEGNIIDANQDFKKGIKNIENFDDLGFEITENGLKQIYNEAPKLEGMEDIEIIDGEEINIKEVLENIKAIDDIDGDITKRIKTELNMYFKEVIDANKIKQGEFDTNNISSCQIKCTVMDSWGKETSKTKIIKVVSKLEKNKINVFGIDDGKKFNIAFDEGTKKLKVENQIEKYIHYYKTIIDKVYFTVKILDKNNNEKAYVELKGEDYGTSEKLNVLKDLNYEYGDILIFNHLEKNRFIIDGEIIDGKENYADGVENEENLYNTVFEITKGGLKAIYNEAPVLNGVEDVTVRKFKNENLHNFDFNMFSSNISAIDDKEGDITKNIKIETVPKDIHIDFETPGEYIFKYSISDKWGRTTEKLRKLTILDESELEKNFIRVDGFGNWGERDKFKIGFDDINKTINIYDEKESTVHTTLGDRDYFKIQLFDKNGVEKKSLTMQASDWVKGGKLDLLRGSKYEYGDLIKLWHAEPSKLHIKGNVIEASKDYSDEITGVGRNDLVLEITKGGLKEVQNLAPTIQGVEEIKVRKGEQFNLLEGVNATDEREGDITSRLLTEGNVDIDKLGEYNVTYIISNSLGIETRVNRKVNVVEIPKLEENKINVFGYNSTLFLTIGFDDFSKEFNVYNQYNDQIHLYYRPQTSDYFSIKILNKNIEEKLNINLIGVDKGTSDKLNNLKKFKFEYGDIIKLYHLEPSTRLKIDGNIIDANEDYSDAIQNRDNIYNTIFQITEAGLKAINIVPVIKGTEELKIRKGENVNLLEGITAEDNLEGNITSKIKINTSNLDINKIGEYTIEYVVSNKLGVETKVNRKINVVEVPKLEKNVMNILGIENHLSFNIGFDDFTKTFKLFNRHNGVIHYVLKNHEYFSIQILDKNMKEKLNISLNGAEKPTSYKLNKLENFKYEYGDFIKIYHKEPKDRMKIDGEIIDGKENYKDGIDNINNVNEVRNMAFEITENGLKYIYNNKPEIKGVKDIIIRQGEVFNKLEGINAIDDIDGDITSKINVVGDLDTNKIGEYKVNYTVEDSWGRQAKAIAHIRVIPKPKLENNFIQVKGIVHSSIGEEKFKIGFDDIKKEFKVYDLKNSTIHDYYENVNYFTIKILNKNRKEKIAINLAGNDRGVSDKLDALKTFKYAYGDRIKLFHAESNRLYINGEVIDAKIDYSQRIWFDTNTVEFEITENGLKAIYNEMPVITGVENTTIKIGEAFDNLEGVVVRDDHDKNLVPVVIGNVDVNKLGNYELTYSVRDSWGAEQNIKRVVTVRSNTKPTITGVNKAIINVGEPFNIMDGISANDVEDNDLTSSIKVKGVVNNNLVGTYIITYTVTDSDGNKVNVARTVVVKSNNKPIITGTENTEIKVGDTFDPLFEVEATDTEDGDLTELINIKGAVNTEVKGSYDLIYSIKDKDGNEAIATRRVIVRSNDKPVLQGIKNSVIKIGDTFDKLVGITAIDTEDKDLTRKISVEGEVDFSKPGVYKLIYNVIDSDGNKVSKIRTVTVKSNNKPTLEGVNNITIKVGDDFEPLVDISANDMEDGDITELIKVENKVDTSKPGEYEVIYSVTDLDKNTTNEKRIVTVRSNDKPIIDGIGKLNLKVGDNFDPRYNVTAKDTEDKDLTQSIKITGTVDTSVEGVTTLIYSVLDSDGNETIARRNITIKSNNKPTLIGINDTTIKVGDIFDNMSDITAYDEEDGDITEAIKIEGVVDANTVGIYNLTYKVVDDDGNEVSENRVVTVRSDTKPNIIGIESMVIKAGDVFDKMKGVSAIDIEDGDITAKLTVQGEVNLDVVGKYELIYSVTDNDENTSIIKRTIRVRSNTKPIITGIEETQIKVGDKFNPLFKVIAKDVEDGDLTHNIEVQNKVNTLQVGEYEVIYIVKDSDNNIVTIPRKVRVRSNNKPIINGADKLTIKVGDVFDPIIGVSAIDTEDGDISNTIKVDNKVDTSKVGTYDVIYSVIDKDGNKITKTRKIKVKSNTKPRFEGVNNITIKVGDDFDFLSGINVHDDEDGDITNLIKVKGDVNTSEVGQYDLIYSVTDKDNNEVISTRRITVRSNNKPVILGADNLVIKSGDSFDKTLGVTATDIENGDLTNSIIIKGEVDTNTPGAYDLIYSVTDNDYNKIAVTRNIIVRTNEKPELIGIDPITIKVGDAFDYMEGIIAMDLEDNDITPNIVVTGNVDTNTIGVYDLVYLIKDSDNNETSVIRKVTVRSNDKPILNGINDATIKINDEFNALNGVSAIDNEDNDVTSAIKVEGNVDKTKEGKYILTYSVMDSDGNETIVSRSVTVVTNNKPNLTGIEDTVIKLDDDFDKLIGVEAIDHEDGEINHLIKVDGEVDVKSVGTYNLVYSVTDSDGNTVESNRIIRVRSNDKPIILGAKNTVIKLGDAFNEREGVIATDTEDKDLTKSIIIKGNVDVNKVGKYVLDYSVDDSDGNKTIKTRVITVRTNEKPIITGADDTTIKVGDDFDTIEGIIVTDVEDGDITDILEIEGDVDTSKVGIYNLIYTLRDEDGNELRKTREITVRSNDKPVILGASQLTIKVGENFDKLKGISAKDTEDGDITNKIFVDGDVDSSKAESYTLFYSVIDNDGNKVKVKRRVIVKTNTKPVIDIDDTTIKIGETLDYKEGVVATDIEDGDLTQAVKVYGDVDNSKAGVYDLTYSVTDKDGNTTTFVRKVTIKTNDIPIIEGINDITIKEKEYFNPMFGVSVTDTEDGDLTKELIINGNFDINNAGKYNLVYSVIDSDGNLVNKTRTIFVKTNNKPIIKGVINTKIKIGDAFDKLKGITAIDTEDGDLTGKIKISGDLDTAKAGIYELVYSVIDSDGNESIIKRQVRVRTNEQPIIEGVEDIAIKVGEDFDLKKDVTALDTEDGDLTSKILINGNIDVNTEGIYNIDYSVKDKDDNETVVTRAITVKTDTKPVIKGVEDVTIKVGDKFQRIAGVTAIDKEDGPITNLINVQGKVNTNALGQYDITYSVEDTDGNITTAVRKVIVRSNTKPEILGLKNIILKVGDSFNALAGITAIDNEDLELTNKIIVKGNVDTNIAHVYRLNYSVTDSDGNKVTATRIVEVKTNEKPILSNVKDVTIKAGDTFELISGEVALDNEDGDISSKIKCVGTLDVNTPGAYELTYSVIDSDGNETTAKRIVNVNSNDKPIIYGVDDLVIKTGDSFNLMDGVNATDTEDGVITNLVNIKGTVDTAITGIYKLVYSVIDKDGNETIMHREVRVRSNEKPIISGADDITIRVGYDFDKFISIEARDKEDGDLTSLIAITGDLDVNKVGVYNLTYSVTDDDGNTTSVNRKITVRSNDKPVIVGAKNTVIKVGDRFDNMYGVTATDTEDKDLTTLLTVKGNVNTSALGTYNLTYTIEDSDNNTTSLTRKVIVRSNDKPIISGINDKILKIGEKFDNLLGIEVKDTEDGDITNRIVVDGQVDVNTIGEYNLTYSVTDDDGNTVSTIRKVIVRSNNKPIIVGANNITIKAGDTFNAMDGIIATDTEDVDLTNSIEIKGSVDVVKQGKYKLTYLVVDSDGNKSIVNRTITVRSNEKPKIIGVKDLTIKVRDSFDERVGIIAKDKEDGDLTKNINIKGYVDTNTLGKYELVYSIVDNDGNISEVVRRIIVRSNEEPKILGIKNSIIKVGEEFNLREGITAIDTEDNDITNSIEIIENLNNTIPGLYEVIYSVTDSDENTTKAKKTIKVESNDIPLIYGVENTTIKIGEAFDPMDGITVVDTEDGDLIDNTYFEGNVDINKIGDYELTYYSKDSDGNKIEARRIVTVRSNDKPIILNADYKTIKVGDSFDAKEGISVIDTEDKDIEKSLKIQGSVDTQVSGVYILKYTVTDSDGNETSIDREITVETNDKPIILGNEDVTIKVGDAFDYFANIIASDTEDGDITNKVYIKGKVDNGKEGLYTLQYGVIDSDKNETIVNKLITVRSNERPVISGTNHITLKLGDTFNEMEGVSVKDREDGDISSKVKVFGDVNLGEIGRYVLTYSIVDSDGNRIESKRVVKVRSNDKPILTGINDETIIVGSDFDASYGIIAEDTEDGDLSDLIDIEGKVDTNTVGKYELKYIVVDHDGNKTIASKVVTVRSNEKPTIKGADIITLKVGDSFDAKAKVIATDKEDGDLTDLIDIVGNVDINKVGNYDLIYSVKDNDGNVVKIKRRIKVRSNEKPIFKGIEDITIKIGDDFDPLIYIEATDYEDGDLSEKIKIDGEVNINEIGKYELIYTVVDHDGNEIKANRIITVRSNENPTITGVNKLTIKVGENFDPMLGVLANDLEDGDITNSVKVKGKVDISIEDEYKLVYSVTDSDGNTLNISRIIKVRSNEKPVLKGVEDTTIKVGDGFDSLAGIVAMDEEDGDLSELIEVTGEVNENIVGEYALIYSITDDDNNTVIAKRVVNVRSNDVPIINGVDSITLKQGDPFDPMINIEALDTEDGNLTNKITVLGEVDTNNIGLYRLTYSVIDSDENETIIRRKVKVRSNDKPEIIGVDNVVIEIGDNFNPLLGVEAIDTEDGDISNLITLTGIVDNRIQGNYPLIYSIKDSDGNISSITRTVTVKPSNAPIILGIEDTSLKLGETFDLMSGVLAKDLNGEDISEDIEVLGFVDNTKSGTYKLIYMVSDDKGNKIILSRNVVVENPTEPIIVGAEDIVVNLNYKFDAMSGIEIHNLKEGVTTTSIDIIGTVDTGVEGDYNLIYVITDSEGNKFTVERVISVTSEDALILNGADDITLRVGDTFDPMVGVILNNYKGEDLTAALKITGTVNTNIPGIYRVIYSALDKDGNLRATTRDIRIVDKNTPIIYGINDLILNLGDRFDPLLGITVRGLNSSNLNSNVKVIGTVDTNNPGTYNLVYNVINEQGKVSTFNRNIEVKNKNGNLIRGVDSLILREGDIFNPMEGVKANYKNEEEITKLIKVIGKVDTNKSGKYKLIYSLTDLQGVKSIVARSILVRNDKESFIQGIEDVVINTGEDFNPMLGVVAKDNENNDLTNLIKVEGKVDITKVGKYNLLYSVIDKEGYKTQIVRTITVKDEKSPKIIGAENIVITDATEFNPMEGIVVRDSTGEDITSKLKLKGMVDDKNGSYELKYSVIDKEGNELEQNRIITVEREDQYKNTDEQEELKILYDESGKVKLKELVPYDEKPKPIGLIGLILMAIGKFLRRKKD